MNNIKPFDTTSLLSPQFKHAEFLAESLVNNGYAWDSSSCGTGKTYVAASILRHIGRPFVILSPKLNIPKWKEVLSKFGLSAEILINYEKLSRGNLKKLYRYKTVGQKGIPHYLRGELRFPKDWIVVCDESHRGKGMESLISGLFFALKNQGYSTLMLSATQMMTPLDGRAFGYMTNLHKGMSTVESENFGMRKFKQWAMEEGGAKPVGKWGAMYFDSHDPESVGKLQSLRKNLFETQKCASRMNRADFGDIFPKNQIECTSYDMGENGVKIKNVYDDMQQELARLEERCQNYSQHILAVLVAARRKIELLKVPSLIELTENLYEENKSVILFVNFTDTIETLVERLGKKFGEEMVGQLHGKQSYKERFDGLESFQSDKKRMMVVNIVAGGECVDMNDITGKHPRASLINPAWRSIAVIQSIGRIERAYSKTDCLTNLVMASGSIEDNVAENFNRKKDHLDLLNDGDLIPNGISFGVRQIVSGGVMNI